jgi:hypothetical protein
MEIFLELLWQLIIKDRLLQIAAHVKRRRDEED